MERLYEVMFIVRPDVVDEELDKLVAGFEGTVTGGGGVIKQTEKLGRRKLAYTVRKFNDGNYILLTIEANGTVVAELERRLRVTEPVIKFITVRMDEEEKRLAKVRAIRNAHQKRSAAPVQHAPAQVAQAPVAAAPVTEPVAVTSVTEAEPVSATA
jgi:small subunit ribosomal protein S6